MSDGEPGPDFEALLDYLRRSRGFDFTGYKRSSLVRRVTKRMAQVGVPVYSDYVDFLEVHPEEFAQLFDTILINVTGFFRDPPAWEALGREVLPRLLAGKRPEEPIRAWSAGCASGEEAYTLAILLAGLLGVEQVRERVKIYATDVDEHALARARLATYDAREVEGLPPEALARYFDEEGSRFVFHKDLRRSVIFGRHDLIQDAPISRVDLLTCRNTLMYFNSETQARILERFHFALNERGTLFLGKAETLLTYNATYSAVDLKNRIFAKVPRGNLRDRVMGLARPAEDVLGAASPQVRIREAAFDSGALAQAVVDAAGLLVLANARARALFALAPADIGRPLQDLQISYRPAELRSCLDRAYVERRPVRLEQVLWATDPTALAYYDVDVVPLLDAGGALLGASITFLDVTATRQLKEDLQAANRELETAYEELQSTNEELETTNEELQSTNEELETTNEELQSTNEELETTNEELQSTNEELETVNDELRRLGADRNLANAYLQSILASLRGGVAVLDSELLVQVWSPQAEELWGLRADESLNKNLLNLDIGLAVDQLRPALRACLGGESRYEELTIEARNRRGTPIRCRITCTPLLGDHVKPGAILMMEDLDAASATGEVATGSRGDGSTP